MHNESLVILSAGEPHNGELPALLTKVNGTSLFDWQVNALSSMHPNTQVILGYASEEFDGLSQYAQLHINKQWQNTGSGYSLFCADLSDDAVIASYADILYRPSLVSKLRESEAEITVVYDSQWQKRFVGRTGDDLSVSEKIMVSEDIILRSGSDIPVDWAHGEFIGLVRIQGEALERLRQLQQHPNDKLNKLSLSSLIEWFRSQGHKVTGIDVQGDWAELNDSKDIAHFILGTKAETLDRLGSLVKKSVIKGQISFSVREWRASSDQIMESIITEFESQKLVVRSSALSEDAFTHSNAGAYTSLLNVMPNSDARDAIEEVIDSYSDCQPDDQVLVQPMVSDVLLSGVAFTRSLEYGAPFYVINYDESGDTESITSGSSTEHKSFYLRKDADASLVSDPNIRSLVISIKEVEDILNYDALDIEFAVDKKGIVFLLQTRPIAVTQAKSVDQADVISMQQNASDKWASLKAPAPHILGSKALFGIMPDWNPAEIIGTNPGQLAVSLYNYLILDDVWATQRAEYGYKDVRPQSLLQQFAGKPYIDIRASFNSFIPKNVPDELSEKLVDFYLNWLESRPYLHDKVEFEVVPTCFGPGFGKWEDRLRESAHLSEQEISCLRDGLLEVTIEAIKRTDKDIRSLHELESRYHEINNDDELSEHQKVRLLLDNCKLYGTLPFAHLARSAFVAVTLLKEGVEEGWLSKEARDGFLETVKTVSHELSEDAYNTSEGRKTWESFLSDYGHLRPGTYDITSPAYNDDPERFLRPLLNGALPPKAASENVDTWERECKEFVESLKGLGLPYEGHTLVEFLKASIEGREKAKFIFTKSLSTALSLITQLGNRVGLSVEELSNIPLSQLYDIFSLDGPIKNSVSLLKDISLDNKRQRDVSRACQLPPLISSFEDFSLFTLTEEKPNFIGSKRVISKIVHIEGYDELSVDVENCIVLIPQADPGYDWLFGHKIAGLITMYGGANSHMAIRSAEFGLPAAIGVGQQSFSSIIKCKTLELDPTGETIRVIN